MSSSVFYKFKSQKEPSRIEFDGTGITVFELKRDIIVKSGLGDGTDFDLAIFDEDGKDEYDDDTAIIPRSTSVIARRLPAMKRGAGRAQRYMTGKMPVNAKNSSRKEQVKSSAKATPAASLQMNSAMTEEERMALMFQQSSEQWNGQLDEMGKQAKVPIHYPNKKQQGSDNEPPPGYVCYRCAEKGHWIKECPTNDDPNWENKPRIKRTTGIPRSFLKTVDKPSASGDGSEDSKPPSGVMVNAEGQFVIAEPDSKSWAQFQAKTKSSAAAQKAAALGDKELQDRGLECAIDKRLFIDPMKTPCCEKTYCNECITNALIESDFTCPGCQTDGVLIDDLKPDAESTLKIQEYLDEKNAAAIKERSKSPSVKAETTPAPEVLSPTSTSNPKSPVSTTKSPNTTKSQPAKVSTPPATVVPVSTTTTTTVPLNPKKRPADELLENPKIPKGPKAMQQQEAQKQAAQFQQQQQQMMNNMGGFPNMFNNMPQNNFYGNAGYGNMPMMNGFMPNMMMNPMMNMYAMNMGGMNGMGMNGGGMNGLNQANGRGGMGMNMNGMNNGMGRGGMNGAGANGMANGNSNSNIPQAGQFPNQQKTIFAEPLPNEEDAYFRKPVNPHRHQGRQRRARPSDYREL